MERSGISETGAASRTAMIAACARGAHLLVHGPRAVLADWLAWPLIGSGAEAIAARGARGIRRRRVAARHLGGGPLAFRRRLAWRVGRGAVRDPRRRARLVCVAAETSGTRVFEVDHPAMQDWKRSRLDALGISVPPELVWVPVDFEVESIADGLARAGVGPAPTFVSWLGVVPYLSVDAIEATLRPSALLPRRLVHGPGGHLAGRAPRRLTDVPRDGDRRRRAAAHAL